jgi:hypothetical protein
MSRISPSGSQVQAVLAGQTLIIESQTIPIEYRSMPLDDVQLDPSNPRIQHAVRRASKNGTISQEDLRNLILDRPGVPELFKSIRDNGGLHDPIFVRPDGRIIEGNCRAASYMKLRGIYPNESRWQTISAVFVPDISDRQVAILQGYYHVAGKNKWDAYEKIGHLHHMRTILGMDDKAIAQAVSMRESEVIRDLKAYETMTEKLIPKIKDGNALEKWSYFQELYKRKDLEEYRSKPANVDAFVSLVVTKKLKRGADVRNLPKILKHPGAVKVLKTEGIDSAMSVVGKADPTADSKVFRKLKQAAKILQHLPRPELQRLRESQESRLILQELFSAVKDAAKAASVKLS